MSFTDYHSRYGYPRWIAVITEVWWRLEHRRGRVGRLGYRQRKAWERRGCKAKTGEAA